MPPLDAIGTVPGVTPALVDRLRAMAAAIAAVREANAAADLESFDFAQLLRPVVRRGLAWLSVCAISDALLHRRVRPLRVWRLIVNGTAVAVIGLLPAWALGTALQIGDRPVDSTWFVFLPVVVAGMPAAIWTLARRRSPRAAGRVLGAWPQACVPAFAIATPLF